MRRSSARGGSIVEYTLLLLGVAAIGLVGATALAGGNKETVEWEGDCLKTFSCKRARGGDASSIAPESHEGDGAASDFWTGIHAELVVTTATVQTLDTGDLGRGLVFMAAHPGAVLKVLGGPRKRANAPLAETAGSSAARLAAPPGLSVIGRLAKVGKVIGAGSEQQQWQSVEALAEEGTWEP